MSVGDGVNQKQCLDLFCGLGGFSSAFADSDRWQVTTVDIDSEFEPDICADVMDLRPQDLPNVDVVLASPPCTRFGKAACWNNYFDNDANPQTESAREHIALVYHTIGLIKAINPTYWFLENPQGKLPAIIGRPTGTVTYCQYGKPYQKRTHLWGDHPLMEYESCSEGNDCHTNTPRSEDRHPTDSGLERDIAERSKVPYDLSKSILEAVEGRGEQATLTETYADA